MSSFTEEKTCYKKTAQVGSDSLEILLLIKSEAVTEVVSLNKNLGIY